MKKDYFRRTLELRIQKAKKEIDNKMEFIRSSLYDAQKALQRGAVPNSCGIIQGTGPTLDQEVAKLDMLVAILKDYDENISELNRMAEEE